MTREFQAIVEGVGSSLVWYARSLFMLRMESGNREWKLDRAVFMRINLAKVTE